MSVTNPTYQASYAGRGDLGPYAITFDVTLDDGGNANDINVQVKDSLGNLADITATSTVTGMNVYTALVYGATYTIIVSRYPDLTQPYTFPYGTKFPSRTFENALDRQCFLLQRLYGDADLALKAPIAESAPGRIPSAADRANHHLAFDASGDPIVSTGIPDVPVSSFMETLLDDADAEEARGTLGIHGVPYYFIAASDSSDLDKENADYVCSAAENIGVLIDALIDTSGITDIRLAAGSFVYTSMIDLHTAHNVKLEGAGPDKTIISMTSNATFLRIDAGYTGVAHVGNFSIVVSAVDVTGFGTIGIINGVSTAAYTKLYVENVTVALTSLTATAATYFRVFYYVANLNGCRIVLATLTDTDVNVYGFDGCKNLAQCSITESGSSAHIWGFRSSKILTSCEFTSAGTGSTQSNGFWTCEQLSSCKADITGTLTTGFESCFFMGACYASGGRFGFSSCYEMAGCKAYLCNDGCFLGCEFLSACDAHDGVAYGFSTCQFMSACRAYSNGSLGFNSCFHVTACYSGSNTTYGFLSCRQMQQNYATGNSTANYSGSYADQSTNACANTSAGGYNR